MWYSQKLIFRMPISPLHEDLKMGVVLEIHNQLEILRAGSDSAADYARSIRPTGSATLEWETKPEPASTS